MSETPFLDAAEDHLYTLLSTVGGNPLKLDPLVQPVVWLNTMQGMIDNGGIRHPLENDFPFTPPYSVFSDAYRKVGAVDLADRFDRAIALFPFENPEAQCELRNQFMDELSEDHEFFALTDAICGDPHIWKLLDSFIEKHAAAFGLTQTDTENASWPNA